MRHPSLKDSGLIHKGARRWYFCQEFLDEKGRLDRKRNGCFEDILSDGEPVPLCPMHDLPLKKTRFKRVDEKEWELQNKSQMQLGTAHIWTDTSNRKAQCGICHGTIEPGEHRIAVESPNRWRATKTASGGFIKSIRRYVHRTCFVDVIMGGEPGDGCPGCTTKMINDEYNIVRKQILAASDEV